MKKIIILTILLTSNFLFASEFVSHHFNSNQQTIDIDQLSKDFKDKSNELRKLIDKKVQRTLFNTADDELILEIVKTASGVYYERMGKEAITKDYPKLTPAQLDVLNFYLLARVASELDRKNFLAEEDSLRLELYRDRRDKLYATLKKIMEKISGVPEKEIKSIG